MTAHRNPYAARSLALFTVLSFSGLGACAKSSAQTDSKSGPNTDPSAAKADNGSGPHAPPSERPEEAPPIAVGLVQARDVTVPRVLTLSGTLVANEQAQVAAGATGKVLATYVERGSVVKKGATLAKIDARILGAQAEEASAQVQSLKAQQAQAKLDCDRTQRMYDKGAIAKADFDKAQTGCATAKWGLAAAEARSSQMAESLRDTQIRAPFSGLVVERAVTAGEYVRPDTRVATLVAVDPLRVQVTVPESDVSLVKQGTVLDFTTAGGGGNKVYRGRVKYISPAIRTQTRDAVIEAIVDNPGNDLRPGMFVTARIALGQQTLPSVPKTALKSEGTQQHVFVAVGGRLEERVVQVAAEGHDGQVPVLNGVKTGEPVVASLTPDVRDGARLK